VALAGLWTTLVDLTTAATGLLLAIHLWAPPQDLPWKPFRLDAPIGLASSGAFARAAGDPALCRRTLTEGGIAVRELPEARDPACGGDALQVRSGLTLLAPGGPRMTCPLALAYAAWDRHTVRPAAERILGASVVGVDHYGTYACRNVYGRAQGRRSEHAFSNALDVAGFRLDDGRRVTVAADFRRDDARGRFLRVVRSGACGWFRAVLSPDYNAAHRDHLHLDFGGFRACR
jgi:hypothetical protein